MAFEEVGPETTLKSIIAFVLLKQSCLSHEDKKKVLTITNGVLEKTAIEGAMRSLSTKVLTGAGSTEKKKVYRTNFIEPEEAEQMKESGYNQAFTMTYEEADDMTQEALRVWQLGGMQMQWLFRLSRKILKNCFRIFQICIQPLFHIMKPVLASPRGSATEDFGLQVKRALVRATSGISVGAARTIEKGVQKAKMNSYKG